MSCVFTAGDMCILFPIMHRGSRAGRKLPDRLPLIYETPTIVFLAREFYRRHPLLYFITASKHTVTKEENIEDWWRESSIYVSLCILHRNEWKKTLISRVKSAREKNFFHSKIYSGNKGNCVIEITFCFIPISKSSVEI